MRPHNRLLLSLALLALPALANAGQPPPARASTGSYIASGPTEEADLARLRAALLKIPGVEQVDLIVRPRGIAVRIRGVQTGTLFAAAAKSAGFDLRPTATRTYQAVGSSSEQDLMRLREALAKAPGVEQVDLSKSNGSIQVRIRGEATASSLAEIAKPLGFEILSVSSYVASGSTADADLAQLRAALEKSAGVRKVELRALPGGAAVVIQGDATSAALTTAAKSVGFGLLPVSDANTRRFQVKGVTTPEDTEKLNKAFQGMEGGGEFHLLKTPDGMQLDVIGSTANPDKIVAAAKAMGVDLTPTETISALSADANGERITPPAPGERIQEELAQVGELAPEFTLITKDGKSKIALSDFRGKKPVVLIFGSYT